MPFATLLHSSLMCWVQVSLLSTIAPINLVQLTVSMMMPSISITLFLPVHFGLLLNNILCVLVMFNDSLFTFNHVVTLHNSLFTSSSSKDTSLYSKNNRGPIIDPCGTPHVILLHCDCTLLYFTNCWRSLRYFSNHDRAFPLIPYWESLFSRILSSTVSKALARSNTVPSHVHDSLELPQFYR